MRDRLKTSTLYWATAAIASQARKDNQLAINDNANLTEFVAFIECTVYLGLLKHFHRPDGLNRLISHVGLQGREMRLCSGVWEGRNR